MKLLPSSLAARTVLLVLAVVLVAEVTTFSLIFNQGRNAHMRRTTDVIAAQVRMLQAVLPGLGDDARRALENAAVGEEGLQLQADSAAVPQHEPRFGFARQLKAGVRDSLGAVDGDLLLRDAGPGERSSLWIGFKAGGERWWLMLPPPRFAPKALPRDLWEWLGVSLAILMLIAGLFVRSIVRPLARLGEAVTATGDGSARKVTPEGPSEVQRLAVRHNTMLEQLAAADAERQEMLAGLTHDLRAPLARLRVRLALLENDVEREGVQRDADDMERIVGQCLAFLRSENHRASGAPLALADAVSDEVARQRELGRPVELVVDSAAAACEVMIDRGDVQRLLDNLIDNALQYGAPPAEVAIFSGGNKSVRLRVRDHGPGIAVEARARALEAFTQVDPARATRGSCGLGLAIVRRIVAACGGEVALADAPGGGLDVLITIPVTSA